MKIASLLTVLLSVGMICHAQQIQDQPQGNIQSDEPTILTPNQMGMTVPGGDAPRNYVNFFGFLNAVYDSNISYETRSGSGSTISAFGGEGAQVGGGASLYHMIKHGSIALNYNGSFTRYTRSQLRNGTNQFLMLSLTKMLTRRWMMSFSEDFSLLANGAQAYSLVPANGAFPSVQPYGSKLFYDTTSLYFSYQQTRRLNYFFGGNFFAAHYRPNNLNGYNGGSGLFGAGYRFSQRTRLDGTYTRSHFSYTAGSAASTLDSVTASLMHEVGQHWRLGATVGVSYVQSSGLASFLLPLSNGIAIVSGRYKTSTFSPIYTGLVTRVFRTSSFTLNGGENVSGGNGVVLTSKNLFLTGSGTKQVGTRIAVSGAFGYSRLSSLSNSVGSYSAVNYGASAGYKLTEHMYLNASYTGWRYPHLAAFRRQYATQFTGGITFASRNYPLGLF